MDHIEIDVCLGDIRGEKLVKARALVDTGATFTCIPKKIAEKLNLIISGEKVKGFYGEGLRRARLNTRPH